LSSVVGLSGSIATATGISAVQGNGSSTSKGIGNSEGSSTVIGVGVSTSNTVGLSQGTSTTIGVGVGAYQSQGQAQGVSTASSIGRAALLTTGSGFGSSVVLSTGRSLAGGRGNSSGSSIVSGTSSSYISLALKYSVPSKVIHSGAIITDYVDLFLVDGKTRAVGVLPKEVSFIATSRKNLNWFLTSGEGLPKNIANPGIVYWIEVSPGFYAIRFRTNMVGSLRLVFTYNRIEVSVTYDVTK
jgi:hypothetical protein